MKYSLILLVISYISLSLCTDTVKIDIIDRPKDCKRIAKAGDKVSMHYDGTLLSGKPFDSSRSRNTPFDFVLGKQQVIKCWDESIPQMCVGEKRRLTCPPEYAYGDRGFGDIIPAKSTLVFEVELLDILSSASGSSTKKEETPKKEEPKTETEPAEEEAHPEHDHPDSFESVDKDGNGEITREEMTAYIKSYSEQEDGENMPEDEEIKTLISEIFQSDDTNKDGSLSKEEYYHGQEQAAKDAEGMDHVDDADLRDEL